MITVKNLRKKWQYEKETALKYDNFWKAIILCALLNKSDDEIKSSDYYRGLK